MMLSEFEKLTGLKVTTAEYAKIEAEYMESPDDKAKFCKMWLKKEGFKSSITQGLRKLNI